MGNGAEINILLPAVVARDARLNSISVTKEGPQRRELLLANRCRARIPLKFADFFEIHI